MFLNSSVFITVELKFLCNGIFVMLFFLSYFLMCVLSFLLYRYNLDFDGLILWLCFNYMMFIRHILWVSVYAVNLVLQSVFIVGGGFKEVFLLFFRRFFRL